MYYLVEGDAVSTAAAPFRGRNPADGTAVAPATDFSPDAGAIDTLGRFAVLECYDYPFYNTLDVNFYASWALLLLWPELDVGVVRDFAATVDLDDTEIVKVGLKGDLAPRKRRGAMPHDLGAPNEDPFLRPNAYHWRAL